MGLYHKRKLPARHTWTLSVYEYLLLEGRDFLGINTPLELALVTPMRSGLAGQLH